METVLERFLYEKRISYQHIATKVNYTRPYITQIVKGQRKLNPELISKLKTVDDDLSKLLEVLGEQVQQELSPELLLMVLLQFEKINFDSLVKFIPKEIIDDLINDMEEKRVYYSCSKDVKSRLKVELFDIKREKFKKYKELSELMEKQEMKEKEFSVNSDLLNKKSTIASEIIELYLTCEEDYMVDNGPVKKFKENLIEEEGIDIEDMLFEHLQNEEFEVDFVDSEVIEAIVDEVQKQIKTTEYHELDEDIVLRREYLNLGNLF